MKKTVITLAVAVATFFAFSSCQMENLPNTSNNGVRVITATFENDGTKTTLNAGTRTTLNADGKTPEWAVGDKLRILDATTYQDVTLAAENITDNKITFTTTLTGSTLYAVYPASATTMENCGDGNISFTIPAIQDGSFASANICVAKSSTTDETNKDNLVFRNATSVLKITTPAEVVGVDVTAANSIAGAVTASFSGSAVSLTTTDLDKNYVSAVGASAPTGNVFYLAVAPVETGSTDVNCYRAETKGSINKGSKELQRNIIYSMDLASLTIDNSDLTGQRGILNGQEYVVVKCGDKNLKWATKNIGADSETDNGYYFFWAGTEGYVHNGSGWEKADGSGNLSNGFKYTNAPYNDGSNYDWKKYNFTDMKGKLDSADDAAQSLLGAGWRMPASAEFTALIGATCWKWDATDKGYYVYVPNPSTDAGKVNAGTGTYDKSNALLFFPAAGNGANNDLKYVESTGYYWSSTSGVPAPYLDESGSIALTIGSSMVQNGHTERQMGCSIRAVSE